MNKDKSQKDYISEEDFNAQMMGAASTNPETDSPGDSEEIAGAEFNMGLNYMPNENNEYEGTKKEPEIIYSSRRGADQTLILPDTARVVSSEEPAPWKDLDKPSDTN